MPFLGGGVLLFWTGVGPGERNNHGVTQISEKGVRKSLWSSRFPSVCAKMTDHMQPLEETTLGVVALESSDITCGERFLRKAMTLREIHAGVVCSWENPVWSGGPPC